MSASVEAPLSPIASAKASTPTITTSKSITSEPQELDGSPISPHPPTTLIGGTVVPARRSSSVGEVGQDIVEYEELSGEPGMMGKSSRQAKIAEKEIRAKDPAVLVNIPKSPAAQDYQVASLHPERQGLPGMDSESFKPVMPTSHSDVSLSTAGGVN